MRKLRRRRGARITARDAPQHHHRIKRASKNFPLYTGTSPHHREDPKFNSIPLVFVMCLGHGGETARGRPILVIFLAKLAGNRDTLLLGRHLQQALPWKRGSRIKPFCFVRQLFLYLLLAIPEKDHKKAAEVHLPGADTTYHPFLNPSHYQRLTMLCVKIHSLIDTVTL